MKEIFKYYLDNCSQCSIYENKLLFEFGDFFVTYGIESGVISHNDIIVINKIEDIEAIIKEMPLFITCTVQGYEYLGWREDIEEGRSISNEMVHFLKRMKAYKAGTIISFFINIEFGDVMCDSHGSYIFNIKINRNYWFDLNFAKVIVELIISTNISVPNFYVEFFKKDEKINDNWIIPIISTNTKVRRLGYFTILSNFLITYTKIPNSFINKKFEDYCLNYKYLLHNNAFTKGLIDKTSSGISAKPYIETALNLNILNKMNNSIHAGKSFKVYQILQKEYSSQSNIFDLSNFDKIFFLESILKNDYFYFTNLLEIFFFEEKTAYKKILEKYQGQLTLCLRGYKNQNDYLDRKTLNNIDTILNRISNWEKPKIYLEHLLMPRINWMLDLGILVDNGSDFAITEIGIKLFKHLSIWNDINTDKIISPISFLERFMIQMYDDCFHNNETQNPDDNNFILEKIYKYIDESFNLFKTLAPNRVTASQAANYTKYKLYLNENIKVDYYDILNFLSTQNRFIFKYQEQYQDGYIQKK